MTKTIQMTEQRDEENREARLRAKAKRQGLMMQKSREPLSRDNEGGFKLVEADGNRVVEGETFNMSLDDVEAYLERD